MPFKDSSKEAGTGSSSGFPGLTGHCDCTSAVKSSSKEDQASSWESASVGRLVSQIIGPTEDPSSTPTTKPPRHAKGQKSYIRLGWSEVYDREEMRQRNVCFYDRSENSDR